MLGTNARDQALTEPQAKLERAMRLISSAMSDLKTQASMVDRLSRAHVILKDNLVEIDGRISGPIKDRNRP